MSAYSIPYSENLQVCAVYGRKRGRSSVSDEVRAQRDDEIAQRSGIPRVRCWIDVIIGCNAHFTSYSVDFCFVLFIVLSVSA